MTQSQLEQLDRRLDQHADATEIILKRLDEIIANAHVRLHRIERFEGRLHELESIVLPDPEPGGPARPTLPRT